MEVRLSAELTRRMIELASLQVGMKVLDLATGRGEPAIPIAHEIGDSGEVHCVDPDASMLEMARLRALSEGVQNLKLIPSQAEALTDLPHAFFDRAFCRWGLMYTSDPKIVVKNVYNGLREGGLFIVAVWGPPEKVDYFSKPREVAARFTDVPTIRFDQPGTFQFAEEGKLAHLLRMANFGVVSEEDYFVPVVETETFDEFLEWHLCFGLRRLFGSESSDLIARWMDAMRERAESFRTPNGFGAGGITKIVVAKKV